MRSSAIVFVGMVYPCGVVRHLAMLGLELFRMVQCSDFYFASTESESNVGSWDLIRAALPTKNILSSDTFLKLTEKCVKLAEKYEIVIIHTGGGWGQTKYFVRARWHLNKLFRSRVIFVGTTHSYRNDSILRIPMSAFQYVLYRMFYRKIIFQCQYAVNRFWGGHDLIRRRVGAVVPLGCEAFPVDVGKIPLSIAGNKELAETLGDDSLFKFVYLAAFRPGKKHRWLVSTMGPILKENPDVRLILCGRHSQIEDEIRQQINILGLASKVIIPGMVDRSDIPWLLKHCNCAISSSVSETFGHNILEPMFAGLPVVGTRVGIGCDIIQEAVTGRFITLTNVKSARAAFESMIANRAKTAKMGQAARQLVVKDYTHAAVARKLSKIYLSILESFAP